MIRPDQARESTASSIALPRSARPGGSRPAGPFHLPGRHWRRAAADRRSPSGVGRRNGRTRAPRGQLSWCFRRRALEWGGGGLFLRWFGRRAPDTSEWRRSTGAVLRASGDRRSPSGVGRPNGGTRVPRGQLRCGFRRRAPEWGVGGLFLRWYGRRAPPRRVRASGGGSAPAISPPADGPGAPRSRPRRGTRGRRPRTGPSGRRSQRPSRRRPVRRSPTRTGAGTRG
jgi:hypothetical protein